MLSPNAGLSQAGEQAAHDARPALIGAGQARADARRALIGARARTLSLVSELSDAQLTSVFSTLLSPLAWDLGHIAAFEDLWISRMLERPLLRPELTAVYDADETPRALRGKLQALSPPEALAFMAGVRERTLEGLDSCPHADPDRIELVIRHELQHTETMLQAFQIAHFPLPAGWEHGRPQPQPQPQPQPEPEPEPEPRPGSSPLVERGGRADRPEPPTRFLALDGGTARIGAGREGFAYDNERPQHELELEPFLIAAKPVTNGDWQRFIDAGGYERSGHWSPGGWDWRRQESARAPLYWSEDGREWILGQQLQPDPDAAVRHICWWEAEAFANWAGARLPTEFEWELAATTASGFGGHGQLWEWTASEFSGYPGFSAYPYREYSEQFFGHGYRVLRGSSWATSPRVAGSTFRNWDLPQRRQIFSGLRLARNIAQERD